jgi:hypothetical protein
VRAKRCDNPHLLRGALRCRWLSPARLVGAQTFQPLPLNVRSRTLCNATFQVLEKLQAIFAGFEENGSEPLYIIMGSFISRPVTRALGGRETIQAAFDALGDIIVKFPRQAENAKFLLVPGTFLVAD